MGEIFAVFIEKLGNHVGIVSCAKGTNVQFKKRRHITEKRECSRSKARMVPRTVRSVQLKMVDAFEVVRNVIVGGVN